MTLEDIKLIERWLRAGYDLDQCLKALPHLEVQDLIDELLALKEDEENG